MDGSVLSAGEDSYNLYPCFDLEIFEKRVMFTCILHVVQVGGRRNTPQHPTPYRRFLGLDLVVAHLQLSIREFFCLQKFILVRVVGDVEAQPRVLALFNIDAGRVFVQLLFGLNFARPLEQGFPEVVIVPR